jgi:hypothetical protein
MRIAVLLVLSLCATARADDQRAKPGAFGIKGGFIMGGTAEGVLASTGQRSFKVTSDDSYSVEAFFEHDLFRMIRATLALDMHDLKFGDSAESVLDVSAGLKATFFTSDRRIAFRPGVLVGKAWLTEIGFVSESTYLTVKAFGEFVIYTERHVGFLIDICQLWAPSGGNDRYDITAGPMTLLRAGLVF